MSLPNNEPMSRPASSGSTIAKEEPKPLIRDQQRRKLATSDSGSDDASKKMEETKFQPKSLRAPPTDDDPFGDRTRIPQLDLAPLEDESAANAVAAVPTTPQTFYVASPSIPYAISVVAQSTGAQLQSGGAQAFSHPTIIVIPSSLTDSLGPQNRAVYDRSYQQAENTASRITNTTTSTTMEPLPFGRMRRESIQNESVSLPPGHKIQKEEMRNITTTQVSSSTGLGSNSKKVKSTLEYNRTFREQRDLLSSSSNNLTDSSKAREGGGGAGAGGAGGRRASDVSLDASRSSIESAKMHILSRPQLLLNVFTFWINLIACHGSVNHNQCVHAMLLDLRQHFLEMVEKKQRSRKMSPNEEQRVDDARKCSQNILDELRLHLQDRSFDTTRSIVSMVNCLGPYVLRHFLVKKGVVSLDPNANDTAVVWASLIASSDPTLPFEDARKITDPGVMLERMAWSKRVSIPGV